MPTVLKPYAVPVALLGLMFVLMVASSWNDSAIIDELAHVPAGYGYVFLQDYRLNPEHPPLAKALAALPLAFSNVRFPTDTKSWREDVNGQWTQGAIFLYEAGNDPSRILRLMRLPLMALAVAFGWLFWAWVRRHFGQNVAHVALFFFALSPTMIAHSRFVTTDLGAAFAFFIGIVSFVRFLSNPSWKNTVLAGVAFGAAELLKFSLILLLPIYGILIIACAASSAQLNWSARARLLAVLAGKTLVIGIIGVLLIWAVYAVTVVNYPAEKQHADAVHILTSFPSRPLVNFDLWLIAHDLTRPLGEYLLGLLMVLQRASGGNNQYFIGGVSAAGDWRYFPLLYLVKEPLAFHVVTLVALGFALRRVFRASAWSAGQTLDWVRKHFIEFASMTMIAVYWTSSVTSPLNIGVRHVLPTFTFIFLLVAREAVLWLRPWRGGATASWWEWIIRIYQVYIASIPRVALIWLLLLWQAVSVLVAFPYYLSYFNELGGGTARGYKIATDSNYDWGQDLRRLRDAVETNGIQKIAVDYFGGGSPRYELGEKFEPWWSARGYPHGIGWFAISASTQMGAYGKPAEDFARKPEDSYEWLKPFRPVARAGTSIFIYQLP